MSDESSTRITMKELYLQVQKIQSMLEKLTNQLPSISDKLDELERDVRNDLSDHEQRIRKVEMRVWQIMALASALAALMPVILRLFP